jgi:hypothetical protein
MNGLVASAQFGTAAAAGYRLNADTFDDIIIGAPRGSDGGRVYLSFGRTRGAPTALRTTSTYEAQLNAPYAGTVVRFGTKVAVGDVDADGDLDLLLYMANPGTTDQRGAVVMFRNDGVGAFPATPSVSFANDVVGSSNDYFGLFVANGAFLGSTALANLNGDAVPELLFGGAQYGAVGGSGLLFFGRSFAATTNLTTVDMAFTPAAGDTTSRGVVGFVGDVTGDGRPDFAVGHSQFGTGRGRILVVH